MVLRYETIPVTAFEQNCSVLWCDVTKKAAVVDPGGDLPEILKIVEKNGLTLEKILITHGHIDHAGAASALSQQLGIPIEGPHIEDAFWIEALPESAMRYGLPKAEAFTPSRWLEHQDRVTVGEEVLEVCHCPGHTPGHVTYISKAARLAWVGDVLFRGSIGRTDFPKGDFKSLISSIRDRLFPLGDDIRFVSGHGPMSSFQEERRSNPFCGDEMV